MPKGFDKISRGNGFRGAVRYIFANYKARFLCASDALAATVADRAISKMGTLARRLKPKIKKPVWHMALRLPKGDFVDDRTFQRIAHDYMKRMGWNRATHQYIAIISDDPEGQHIHIVANRVGIDGRVYYGRNENLISTRVIQELERDQTENYGLTLTEGPRYVLDARGVPRAVLGEAQDKKLSKNEHRKADRLAAAGQVQLPPRKATQRILRAALEAGMAGGGLGAFLDASERAGMRVLANVASTGRANGLSFEFDGIPFKASQVGDQYAWSLLSKKLGYRADRDLELLMSRSLKHVTEAGLPHLGQPVSPVPTLLAPPAAAIPMVISPTVKEVNYVPRYAPRYQASHRNRGASATSARRGSLAGSPSLNRVRALPGSHVDAAGDTRGSSGAEGLLHGNAGVQLRALGRADSGLRSAATGSNGSRVRLTRNPNLLAAAHQMLTAEREAELDHRDRVLARAQVEAVARAQVKARADAEARAAVARVATEAEAIALEPNFVVGTGVVITITCILDEALRGFTVKPGHFGHLYIRSSDDAFALLEMPDRIKFRETDTQSLRAGLALAASKWERITLSGSDEFKARAMRVATSLGIAGRVANPELHALRLSAQASSMAAAMPVARSELASKAPQPTNTKMNRPIPRPF